MRFYTHTKKMFFEIFYQVLLSLYFPPTVEVAVSQNLCGMGAGWRRSPAALLAPLYITRGKGSGRSRVLVLWCHGLMLKPEHVG